MNKYDCRFFPNGRVVFILWDDIDKAVESGKELLVICNSWSGGYAIAIGANETYDYYSDKKDKKCWEMYSYDVRDVEFTTEELSKFYKVIVTSGEKIMMKTGNEANAYQAHGFIDWDTKYETFKHSFYNYGHNFSEEEFEKMRREVDVQFTINMMNGKTDEEKDEKCRALSSYAIGHWVGTKYEAEYNK